MLEFMICSLLTIFPDYLFRRYVLGKRINREINLYSMWFELRWGITACVILTVSLITMIFYFHPSTTNVTAIFRTAPSCRKRMAACRKCMSAPMTKWLPALRGNVKSDT